MASTIPTEEGAPPAAAETVVVVPQQAVAEEVTSTVAATTVKEEEVTSTVAATAVKEEEGPEPTKSTEPEVAESVPVAVEVTTITAVEVTPAETAPVETTPTEPVVVVEPVAVPEAAPTTPAPEAVPEATPAAVEAPAAPTGPVWPTLDDSHILAKFQARLPKLLEDAGHDLIWGIKLSATAPIPFHTTLILQKFLRANENRIEDAYTQLLDTLKWRKEFNPEAAIDETFSEERFKGLGYVNTIKTKEGERVVTWNIYGACKEPKKTFGDLDG